MEPKINSADTLSSASDNGSDEQARVKAMDHFAGALE
jgi:hypothetical protein